MSDDHNPIVLVAIEDLDGGGAERVAIDLVTHWPKSHGTAILLVSAIKGGYRDQLPENLKIIEIGVSSSPWNTLQFLIKLKRIISNKNIIGIVSHMTSMNRMVLRAKLFRIIKAPIIVVEHNNFIKNNDVKNMNWFKYLLLISEIIFLYKLASYVIGCSIGVTNQIRNLFKINERSIRTIINPISEKYLNYSADSSNLPIWFSQLSRPIYISVGRLSAQKGYDDLIYAFSKIEGSLIILGEGPLRKTLADLSERLGIKARVVMPGFINSPRDIMSFSDVYVSSSLWEGYPLVLLEAYACGLPIVARDCEFGPSEIVTDRRPGILVRGNTIEDLAHAMEECAKNEKRFTPGTRVNLSENNPVYVAKQYSLLF